MRFIHVNLRKVINQIKSFYSSFFQEDNSSTQQQVVNEDSVQLKEPKVNNSNSKVSTEQFQSSHLNKSNSNKIDSTKSNFTNNHFTRNNSTQSSFNPSVSNQPFDSELSNSNQDKLNFLNQAISRENDSAKEDLFKKNLNHRLNIAKLRNLSVSTIPSPGVIIKLDCFNSQNQLVKIYAYNKPNEQITLTDNGLVLKDVIKKHPRLQLDVQQLEQAGVYVSNSKPKKLYINSSLSHFIYDFQKLSKVIKALEQ